MASRTPFNYPRFQAFDGKGKPLEGGTAEFFDAGTTNNRTVYSDPGLNTAAPNPITLNSRGEPESGGGTPIDIYFDSSTYKIVLKDSDGNTVWTIDNFIQDDLSDISEPKDPKDVTDTGTDTFEGTLNRDPNSGEEFTLDFQSANTTTTPTFENTGGSLGALTIKTRDGSALWAGALEGVHTLKYDGTDYLLRDPALNSGAEYAAAMDQGVATSDSPVFSELMVNGQLKEDPEHATDSGTDTFNSATNTSPSGSGKVILRDFQSSSTTTTPTLDSLTITTKDGSALWAGALLGVHELQLNVGATAWLVLDPNPLIPAGTQATSSNTANAIVQRDANGRAKFSDPSAAQDAATKSYVDGTTTGGLRFAERTESRTNRLANPSFKHGFADWQIGKATVSGLYEFAGKSPANGPFIDRIQLTSISTSDPHSINSAGLFNVDPDKSYYAGAEAEATAGAPLDMDILVVPLDESLSNLGTLSVTRSVGGTRAHHISQINPQGGSAPAWPAGTVSCYVIFRNVGTGAAEETLNIGQAYLIAEEEWPGTQTTAQNNGFGTHEGYWDGSHLYVLASSWSELVKYDADLVRQNAITTSDYPHDLTILDGSLWLVSYEGDEIQEFDVSTFSLLNTYTINGTRAGYGITNDGTTLFAGIGNSDNGETPAIISIDPADGSQAVLSTDVEGGAANIPIEVLDGSLWSIHRTNSEVKRISKAGTTEATISTDGGILYGLGVGGGYVFANGSRGVVQIDPATDSVVATYRFRLPGNSAGVANVEVADDYAVASGLVIDHAAQTSQEVAIESGWKWCRSIGDNKFVVGALGSPWLSVVGLE